MAIVYAIKSGNWSDVTVWNTGALPTSSDDVRSNNFTVTVDTSPTVLSVSNKAEGSAVLGGQFNLSNGVTLTCTATQGVISGVTNTAAVNFLLAASNTATIAANCVSSGLTSSTYAVRNNGTGTLIINGNCTAGQNPSSHGAYNQSTGTLIINGTITGGGNSSAYGAMNVSSGTLIINGDVIPGTTGIGVYNNANGILTVVGNITGGPSSSAYGAMNGSTGTLNVTGRVQGGTGPSTPAIYNNSNGSINIIGDVIGGSNSNVQGVYNSSLGSITITGSVTGGPSSSAYGAYNNSNGSITITGNVTGGNGSSAHGAYNNSSGLITITGNVTGGSGSSANGAYNNSIGTLRVSGTVTGSANANGVGSGVMGQVTRLTGPFISHSSGVAAVAALSWRWESSLVATSMSVRTYDLSADRVLYSDESYNTGLPAISNVRSGVTYGAGKNLVGTCEVPNASLVAAGTPVDNTIGTAAITAETIRAAIGLNSANLDTQLSSVFTTSDRTKLNAIPTNPLLTNDTRLSNLDATISSRLATTGYTPPANNDITAIRAKTDNLRFTIANQVDANALSGGGSSTGGGSLTAQQVWEYSTRSLTDNSGFSSASEIAQTLLTTNLEDGLTLQQAIQAITAVIFGKTTITPGSNGAASVIFRNPGDTKDRVVAQMQKSERTSITCDFS